MKTPSAYLGIGELARGAGVSVQHCRDLETLNVLPAAGRTPGGHRRYGRNHVLALYAYETLAAGRGFSRARRVLSLVNDRRVGEALELLDEWHATIHRQRQETRTALQMLLGVEIDEPMIASADMSIGEAARRIGVSVSTLRYWEGEGLVAPGRDGRNGYRRYRRRDMLQLRVVRVLRETGYTIEQVEEVVASLRQGRPERAFELAQHRIRELADASKAALAGDVALWDYLQTVAELDVCSVAPHILYR